MSVLTLADAQALVIAAQQKADELGIKVCVAVIDHSTQLQAFARMDGAFLGSVDVAIKKAKTAMLFPLPTDIFGALVRSAEFTGMELTNDGLIGFAGGVPIMRADQHIAGIGISGGSAEQDNEIAQFAIQQCIK